MEKIRVTFENNELIEVPKMTTLLELSKKVNRKYPILLAEVNNELRELHNILDRDCSVRFLDITDANGFRAYQRSVVFLMICATKDVLGVLSRVRVEHSINKNYYCEIDDENVEITESLLNSIEDKMREYIESGTMIEKKPLPTDEAIQIAEQFGLYDKMNILKYKRTSNVNFYKLGKYYNYFYGQMVLDTSRLRKFKLSKSDSGFMLQFPSSNAPGDLAELKSVKKITQIFNESNRWSRILKISTVGELNNAICQGNLGDIIRISEALHEKKIAYIADMILEQKKNIILISGPSSSGKTTFAERLCIQLRVNGLRPHVISLDNYFFNREFVPLDEFGKPNFENLDFLDVEQINKDLVNLLKGETVEFPTYNFITGKREYKGNYKKLNSDEVIVMEGIHGLNEKLSADIPRANKFKIFISALTQLNIDDHNRIPTSDTRLIRRIVRDSIYRNYSAQNTIDIWPKVLKGEIRNIFPFQEEADALFNSALIYEMCVLRQFVESGLFDIDRQCKEFVEARRLVKFLDCFQCINSEQIPPNSILREFIGGSCFHA